MHVKTLGKGASFMVLSRVPAFILLALWAGISLACLPAYSEESPGSDSLRRGIAYCDEVQFDEAINELTAAIEQGLEDKDDLIKAYRYLAYAHLAHGEKDTARYYLRNALNLKPAYELGRDEELTPKFLEIFAEEKEAYLRVWFRKVTFGLGIPYASIKGRFGSRLSGEIRIATSYNIWTYGLRGYYNINPGSRTVYYWGLEWDTLTFIREIEGFGQVLMPFAGLEWFVSPKLAFCVDMGVAFITLTGGGKEVYATQWVFNLGINHTVLSAP